MEKKVSDEKQKTKLDLNPFGKLQLRPSQEHWPPGIQFQPSIKLAVSSVISDFLNFLKEVLIWKTFFYERIVNINRSSFFLIVPTFQLQAGVSQKAKSKKLSFQKYPTAS